MSTAAALTQTDRIAAAIRLSRPDAEGNVSAYIAGVCIGDILRGDLPMANGNDRAVWMARTAHNGTTKVSSGQLRRRDAIALLAQTPRAIRTYRAEAIRGTYGLDERNRVSAEETAAADAAAIENERAAAETGRRNADAAQLANDIRELARTIATQAQAIADGNVGNLAAAAALVASNGDTLREWAKRATA